MTYNRILGELRVYMFKTSYPLCVALKKVIFLTIVFKERAIPATLRLHENDPDNTIYQNMALTFNI